jgi:hypothetical protein
MWGRLAVAAERPVLRAAERPAGASPEPAEALGRLRHRVLTQVVQVPQQAPGPVHGLGQPLVEPFCPESERRHRAPPPVDLEIQSRYICNVRQLLRIHKI